jgi:hypothetical protein
MATLKPSPLRLRELLTYNPETGEFHWLPRDDGRWNGRWAGQRAGSASKRGYRHLSFGAAGPISEHLVAWAYMTGSWPAKGVLLDHRNGDCGDNRWANLREASAGENSRNRKTSSAFKGVRATKSGRYRAHITLGVYDTPEEAARAYDEAAKMWHGDFARGNFGYG